MPSFLNDKVRPNKTSDTKRAVLCDLNGKRVDSEIVHSYGDRIALRQRWLDKYGPDHTIFYNHDVKDSEL